MRNYRAIPFHTALWFGPLFCRGKFKLLFCTKCSKMNGERQVGTETQRPQRTDKASRSIHTVQQSVKQKKRLNTGTTKRLTCDCWGESCAHPWTRWLAAGESYECAAPGWQPPLPERLTGCVRPLRNFPYLQENKQTIHIKNRETKKKQRKKVRNTICAYVHRHHFFQAFMNLAFGARRAFAICFLFWNVTLSRLDGQHTVVTMVSTVHPERQEGTRCNDSHRYTEGTLNWLIFIFHILLWGCIKGNQSWSHSKCVHYST